MEPNQPQNNYSDSEGTQAQAPAPIPSPTPSPKPQRKSNMKAIAVATLIAILLLVIGFLAYLLFIEKNATSNKSETSTTTSDAENNSDDSQLVTPDPYEGWKTFSKDGDALGIEAASLTVVSDFRYPADWVKLPMIDCQLGIGKNASGYMCLNGRQYANDQTVDSYINSLVARNEGFAIDKTVAIDGVRTVVVSKTGNVSPSSGGKTFSAFVDNLESIGNSMNVGTVFDYAPDSTDATERERFITEVEKVLQSIKL